MENERAVVGHNGAPDPISLALDPYADVLAEVENWTDGTAVENWGQLEATDVLLKELKAARKAVDAARDEETKPLHKAWQDASARWKPTQDDLDRLVRCLVAAQAPFKQKCADEKAAAARKAREEADAKAEAARQAHLAANAASIEEQRKADELLKEADKAQKAANRASKDRVAGMRTVQKFSIESHKAALSWIIANDRDTVTAFIDSYVQSNFKTRQIDGVIVTSVMEAF